MTQRTEFFRAGVGAIITNNDGLVLALERAKIIGAWQMPQGGLHAGEEPVDSVLREVLEETGIPSYRLRMIEAYPELIAYELPSAARSEKTGRGQVHYWFLFRLEGDCNAIDLQGSTEFRSWRWMTLHDLIAETVDFRKPGYERLALHFARHLASTPPRAQG